MNGVKLLKPEGAETTTRMDYSREGRREKKGSFQNDSGKGPAGLGEGDKRDGAVREVPEPENQRKERTVEAGREGSPDLATHAHGIEKAGGSPSLIMAASIASVPCLMASRGLLFLTTAFKTSIQYFACTSDLSGVS